MNDQDEALRRLQKTFQRERTERELEAHTETLAGTAAKPRRRFPLSRGRLLVAAVALLVVVAIAIPVIMAVASLEQRSSIADSAQAFCTDLTDHNDTAAYGMLSHREREAWSESTFSDAVRSAHLTSCYVSTSNEPLVVSGNAATVPVNYVYSDAAGSSTSTSDTMALIYENGAWHIDSVDWVTGAPAS
ncbi:MAG TPA: hypothetical protein VF116_18730 [Ktedonobacterales bacterium]